MDELALVSLLLAAVALVSCLSVGNGRAIRRLPRAVWVAVILLLPVLGPIAWFVFGRPLSLHVSRPGLRRLTGFRRPPRVSGPDDDIEFLRSIDLPPDKEDDEGTGRRSGPAG